MPLTSIAFNGSAGQAFETTVFPKGQGGGGAVKLVLEDAASKLLSVLESECLHAPSRPCKIDINRMIFIFILGHLFNN